MDETEIAEALASLEEKSLGRIKSTEEKLGAIETALGDLQKGLVLGGGGSRGPDDVLAPQQNANLAAAVRALLKGDQSKANSLFEQVSVKSAIANSDPSGGYFILPQVGSEIIRISADISPISRLARTVTIDAGMAYEEIVDANQAAAVWVGETDSRPDTNTPALNKIRIELNEIYAQPKATQLLVDSASYDVLGWLTDKVGTAFAIAESAAFHYGTGVAQPRGFLTLPTSTAGDKTRPLGTVQYVPSGANGAFPTASATVNSADCLQDLIAALRVPYRANAAFLMNRGVAGQVAKLKDGNSGRWLWQDSLVQGEPPTLLGYPVYLSEDMPDITNGSCSIAFGDWRQFYLVLRRMGLRLLVDPYTDKPYIKLYSYTRLGGGVADSNAVKLLKFSGS